MKKIKLTRGKVTLVDNDDFEKLSKFKWYVNFHTSTSYAVRTRRKNEKGSNMIGMHRLIMNCPKGLIVDHIDGNGLNNRKSNLRVVDARTNQLNRKQHRKRKNGTFGFTKINGNKNKPYLAQIRIQGVKKHLGLYKTQKLAHMAYLTALENLKTTK